MLKLCEKEGDSPMEQYMPIVWIGFAIFMLLCEGFTTQLVSIWFVLGSICAAVTTIFTSDITIQSAVFLVVSLVSLIVTRPLVKRFKRRNKTTGTNADRHIGQVGFMLTDLTDIDETAQAKNGLACKNSVHRQNFKKGFIKRASNRLPSTAWSE